MATNPTPPPTVRPVQRGKYWVGLDPVTGLYFKLPPSRHSLTPRWVQSPDDASGWSERWAVAWAASQYGIKEAPHERAV